MLFALFRSAAISLALLFMSSSAFASLTTDLQGLVTQLAAIRTQIDAIQIPSTTACVDLKSLDTSIKSFTLNVNQVTAAIPSTVTLTTTDLTSLDNLSTLALATATDASYLSGQLRNLDDVATVFEYRTAMSAMLRLSDDIGTMADRILEMADRILVMSTNIGTMADRILLTQRLQNQNIALIQSAMLTTQTNMVALSASLSTIGYNLSLGQLQSDTEALSFQMGGISLTSSNMASQLYLFETSAALLVASTNSLYALLEQNSTNLSHYINGDTLTLMGDLSGVNSALASALDTYAQQINALAPLTNTVVLSDATSSMLRLTADIGVMSGRIMEMVDKIIVMADNIGVMSDRIVETEQIQQTNLVLTQNSLLSAQSVTINVIKNMGL
ncbi:MAG: hypothetical protein Q7U80_11650 [Thiobacillus sp.]|nr:hypothetical protein [Thiobacillus sp.]